MANTVLTGYVAECFWPGVREDDLRELGRRIERCLAGVASDAGPVRYLGWLLVIDDEVALIMFDGSMATIRRVAETAQIPFGRLLQATLASWPPNAPANERALE